jgi:hypothetical protein
LKHGRRHCVDASAPGRVDAKRPTSSQLTMRRPR